MDSQRSRNSAAQPTKVGQVGSRGNREQIENRRHKTQQQQQQQVAATQKRLAIRNLVDRVSDSGQQQKLQQVQPLVVRSKLRGTSIITLQH